MLRNNTFTCWSNFTFKYLLDSMRGSFGDSSKRNVKSLLHSWLLVARVIFHFPFPRFSWITKSLSHDWFIEILEITMMFKNTRTTAAIIIRHKTPPTLPAFSTPTKSYIEYFYFRNFPTRKWNINLCCVTPKVFVTFIQVALIRCSITN